MRLRAREDAEVLVPTRPGALVAADGRRVELTVLDGFVELEPWRHGALVGRASAWVVAGGTESLSLGP